MPAILHRGMRRRTISEINMVPFIDVMLVLLIIFMVTAPLITAGVVDLPTVGKAQQMKDPHVIELVVGADENLRLRIDETLGLVPEISGNRLMAAVRFMKQEASDRMHPANDDVSFEMTLCS